MIGGVDLRNAAMVALEAQAVRRDDAFELVQRREAADISREAVSHSTSRRTTSFSNFDGLP